MRGIEALVTPFVRLTRGESLADRNVTSEARFCLELWRATIVLHILQPAVMAVSIESIAFRTILYSEDDYVDPEEESEDRSDYRVIMDAGPEGYGVGIYGKGGECIAYTAYTLPFEAKESKYQNIREFMGIILAIWMAISVVGRGTIPDEDILTMEWVGDNVSALT